MFAMFPPASYDAKATRESKDGVSPGGLQWQSATGWNLGGEMLRNDDSTEFETLETVEAPLEEYTPEN